MSKKIKYTDGPIGDVKVVRDALPSPYKKLNAMFEKTIRRATQQFKRTGKPVREYAMGYYAANAELFPAKCCQ